jgi:hypothetical protein
VEGPVSGAPPGGMVRRDAYEHLRDEMLAQLRRAHEAQARPVDAVLLALREPQLTARPAPSCRAAAGSEPLRAPAQFHGT